MSAPGQGTSWPPYAQLLLVQERSVEGAECVHSSNLSFWEHSIFGHQQFVLVVAI